MREIDYLSEGELIIYFDETELKLSVGCSNTDGDVLYAAVVKNDTDVKPNKLQKAYATLIGRLLDMRAIKFFMKSGETIEIELRGGKRFKNRWMNRKQ